MPAARSRSALSDRTASGTAASSASRASRAESRTAVRARICAIPSSRLSCSVRCGVLPDPLVPLLLPAPLAPVPRTRACSSRTSSATAWNLVRTAGVTRRRSTAASTSRTARASTEITSSGPVARRCWRGAGRRASACRRGRATNSSSERAATGRTLRSTAGTEVRACAAADRLFQHAAGPPDPARSTSRKRKDRRMQAPSHRQLIDGTVDPVGEVAPEPSSVPPRGGGRTVILAPVGAQAGGASADQCAVDQLTQLRTDGIPARGQQLGHEHDRDVLCRIDPERGAGRAAPGELAG